MVAKLNLYSCTVTSTKPPFNSANIDFVADEITKEAVARIVAKRFIDDSLVAVTGLTCIQKDIYLVLGRESVEFQKV